MEKKNMKKMNKKGFTLVEIMIVVAIIGLLAAIGIPSFQKARSTSREKSCLNNLRMIDAAKEQWAMESNAVDDASPVAGNLDDYIRGGSAALICPAGGTTFADSYTINAMNVSATCQKDATHIID
jgi:prepilin-type N-terminal cleavage/methylation domain-containing protein